MRSSVYYTIIIIIILLNTFSYSQDKIINVWSAEISGGINNSSYAETTILTENDEHIINVTNPTLTTYFASPEINNGTVVVICPDWEYRKLAIPNEGIAVTRWLNQKGISVFILKYRLPNNSNMENKTIGPLQDIQESIRIVRRNLKQWNINPNKICVMGFSAGGHLAASVSTLYNYNAYEHHSISARPDFSILLYPVVLMKRKNNFPESTTRESLLGNTPDEKLENLFSAELHVDENTPLAFIIHSVNEGSVSVQNSIIYFLALKKSDVSAELHLYESGGHGYGITGIGGSESHWHWTDACEQWLKMHGLSNKII